MRKVVLGLSGGIDSTTLLGYLLEQGFVVHCCFFNYGSKHNLYEEQAVAKILQWYQTNFLKKVHFHYFDMSMVFLPFTSSLLKTGEEIPEGDYKDDSMKSTIVPGRNLIISAIMAGLAESISAESIAIGVQKGDFYVYPDCRPEFIKSLNETISFSSNNSVHAITPFIDMAKKDIIDAALQLQVPLHLTRTCYKDQEIACGKCGSCVERLEAFNHLNVKDPIAYE